LRETLGKALGREFAMADEFGLVTELGQDRVEHDPAERIVLDAQDPQRRPRPRCRVTMAAGAAGRGRLGPRQHHRQREGGAAAGALRHHDVATHRAGDLPHRRQTEAGAAEALRDGHIGLGERTEQPLDLGQRQPDAAVGDREHDADALLRAAGERRGLQGDAAALGELHGIIDQIFQCRAQPHRIADHEGRQPRRDRHRCAQPLGGGTAGQRIAGIARQRPQVEEFVPDPETGLAAARRIDEQRGEASQMFGAGLDGVDPTALALAEVGGRQQIADRENSGQRRAHFMGEGRQRRLHHAGAAIPRLCARLGTRLGVRLRLRLGPRLDV